MKNKDKKVRPKKVKVRKKDKFKAIKKAIVPAYIAPQFLEKNMVLSRYLNQVYLY